MKQIDIEYGVELAKWLKENKASNQRSSPTDKSNKIYTLRSIK
jgi:hypothetical protein